MYEVVHRNTEDKLHGMKAIVIAKSKKENTAKLCLILNYRIPIGEYVLEFPAGQKEAEESNETCAIREVKVIYIITNNLIGRDRVYWKINSCFSYRKCCSVRSMEE